MIDITSHILPPSVDLRPAIQQIEDQGQAGTCTANAAASLLEIEFERLHDKYPSIAIPNLSRLYIYYWERNFEGRVGQGGAYPKDMMEALRVKGVCTEALWPYDLSQQEVQPPVACDLEAKQYWVREYTALHPTEDVTKWALAADLFRINTKHAMAQGRPGLVSFSVTQSFKDAGNTIKDWKQFTWDPEATPANPALGGHEVVLIGYDDDAQRFLAQNSWSPQWGDGGFFGIPYAFFGLWTVVTSAYCTLKDCAGNIPVVDYLPRVYDQARAENIRRYLGESLIAPIVTDARIYGATNDEVDAAMSWPIGTSKTIFNI